MNEIFHSSGILFVSIHKLKRLVIGWAIAVEIAFNIDPSISVTPGDDFSFNLFRRSNTSEVETGQNLKASM